MPDKLTELRDAAEFEQLLTESARRPVLLYKHSLSCGTSAEALDELLEHISRGGSDTRYAMVTVQTHRDLSNLIAKTLGVAVGQIAKTILLMVDDAPVVVVISGDRRVDFKKVKALRGRISGLAQPTYVLDVPGGHGKVPIGPGYLGDDPSALTVEDAFGGRHRYPG